MTDQFVLVTGGTGFLASRCIARLLQQGDAVRTTVCSLGKAEIVRAAIATVGDPGDQLSVPVAALTSDDGWAAAMDRAPAVLQVASPPGGEGNRGETRIVVVPAAEGTVRVLNAARTAHGPRVVVTSCGAAATSVGPAHAKAPTRTLPHHAFRPIARFQPQLDALVFRLGRHTRASSHRARDIPGWQTRPARETVFDSAESLLS